MSGLLARAFRPLPADAGSPSFGAGTGLTLSQATADGNDAGSAGSNRFTARAAIRRQRGVVFASGQRIATRFPNGAPTAKTPNPCAFSIFRNGRRVNSSST
jgi:hypothetical protein